MDFQTLLVGCGIDLRDTALCLHKPNNPRTRDRLAILAETERDLFETYQTTHGTGPEATLKKRVVMASFLSRGDGTLVFVGLYRQCGWATPSPEEMDADPRFQRLWKRLDQDFRIATDARTQKSGVACVRFHLDPMPDLAALGGRLIVADPGTRAYMRLAETTPLSVLEITRTPDLSPPVPEWRDIALTADHLRALPRSWAQALRHWRGIYLITDAVDGARYVGAAYGTDNLLGRWQAHVSGDFGVTLELAKRRPDTFRFSILDLLSPAATLDEVTRLEQQWMTRLHSRQFGLNA